MDGFIAKPSRRCPEEKANFISKVFFWWMKESFVIGARRGLEIEDMYLPMKSDESKLLTDKLERAWNKELSKLKNVENAPSSKMKKSTETSKPSLARAIFTVFWWDYLKVGIEMLMMCAGVRTLQPLIQKGIIAHFDATGTMTKTPRDVALYYAAGFVVTTFVVVMLHNHHTVSFQKVAMRVRVSCSSLMYRKILRLNKTSLDLTTPGQIVNLLSNDVSRFDVVAVLLNQLWIAPIQMIVIGSLMYSIIGPAALAGLTFLLIVIMPFQLIMNRYSKRLRRKIAVFTDERIQPMGELINGIQVVKMYAWEKPFANIVTSARFAEMKAIRNTTYLRSLTLSLTIFSDKLNLFFTLLAYVLSGNVLTAEITFTIVMYFNIIRAASLYFFNALMQAGETAISIRRLQEFLLLDEVSAEAVEVQSSDAKKCYDNLTFESDTVLSFSAQPLPEFKKINEDKCDETTLAKETKKNVCENAVFIELQRVTATWKIGEMPSTLCDLSMKIRGGELCALVGPVGSGKSSVLNVILRELPIGDGNLYLRQREPKDSEELTMKRGYVTDVPDLTISYTSQDAWLFVGTVRDNILFGQPWDPTRYREVTKVCALQRDINQWPNGDMTIVGERGIVLSGGQKARVNLARAVYKRADIYLFDDPLSAVDTRVGRHLFKKCIKNYLRGKTRILVTHQLQYLKSADTIVILDRGFVRSQGTFEELNKTSNEFITLMNKLKKSKESGDEEKTTEDCNDEKKTKESDNVRRCDSHASFDSLTMSLDYSVDDVISYGSGSQTSEIIDKGTMSRSVWKRYFQGGGRFFTIIFAIPMFFITQVTLTGTDFWISYWSNLEALRGNTREYDNFVNRKQYFSYFNNTVFAYFSILDSHGLLTRLWSINIYTFLIICCVLLSLGQCFAFMAICMRASENLHKSMFHSVLHTTMRFFNTNPSGRILNRFTKDVGTMDELLPRAMLDATQSVLFVIGVFVSIIIIDPWMFIPMTILFVALYFITKYYLRVANGIKRLEGIAKSPVFSQVNATLQGLPTIRSNGPAISEILRNQFDSYQDVHSGAWYLSVVASSSFGFYVDIFASLFIACVCFSLILFENGETSGGSAGLAMSQAIKLINLLQFGVKQSAETYAFMSSIERILQYVDMKSEGTFISENPPPADWPSKGRLSLKNVYLNYDDENSPVLKGLNLTIEAGWKVGVVGRTGAGKSSLISAIFRLENEGLDGEIKIDGRDTSTLGLRELRSRISIIPQQSVLFSGTLRYNIDPFDSYTDDALWDALKEVELGNLRLDQRVSEGGSNFSVGQRQLICLARAILSKNRILILDEATANIDSHTDALIQKTLKTKFYRHTVITVAHRLITIIESDRIVVMESGQVAELGCPYELLSEYPDGPFAEMVRQAGPSVANNLLKLAEATCQRVLPQHSLDLENSVDSEINLPFDDIRQ